MSFDVILPFLRPIAPLLEDPDITEIMVNGSRRVFVERHGVLCEACDVRIDERNLRVAVKNIARALGDDVRVSLQDRVEVRLDLVVEVLRFLDLSR